ncbi:hypothetical protein DCO57_09380 [Labrenzia sp. 011]|nr:hypothetical protein DCO57_09380 [Labrenzia sp. 011]
MPPGDYEVLIEEERLDGRGFLAYRKTATYVFVAGKGRNAGKMEKLEFSGIDLETMLGQNRETPENTPTGDAALSPQEDLK